MKVRIKNRGESKGQKTFDDTIVQLSDFNLLIICIKDVLVCELLLQVV